MTTITWEAESRSVLGSANWPERSDAAHHRGAAAGAVIPRRTGGHASGIHATSASSPRRISPAHEMPSPCEPTVLVFRDGHHQEVTNYAIMGQTVYVLGDRTQKIPLANLDVAPQLRQMTIAVWSSRFPPLSFLRRRKIQTCSRRERPTRTLTQRQMWRRLCRKEWPPKQAKHTLCASPSNTANNPM